MIAENIDNVLIFGKCHIRGKIGRIMPFDKSGDNAIA